jgi:hypothetical protein
MSYHSAAKAAASSLGGLLCDCPQYGISASSPSHPHNHVFLLPSLILLPLRSLCGWPRADRLPGDETLTLRRAALGCDRGNGVVFPGRARQSVTTLCSSGKSCRTWVGVSPSRPGHPTTSTNLHYTRHANHGCLHNCSGFLYVDAARRGNIRQEYSELKTISQSKLCQEN